jgi:hypothetical protein
VSRFRVWHVEADRLSAGTPADPLASIQGRVSVYLTDGPTEVTFSDWRGPVPRLGDRFEVAIAPVEDDE